MLKAICLGAACATQQLAWFVTPFLLIGLYALRRGDGPTRKALRQVGSFAAIGAITWLVIDLPFIVRDAPAWAEGVLLVLTQHAIPHGQGLIDVSFYLTDGSAALNFYSYAALLLGAGLLVATALWVRRLGPALTVIPWLVFYLSVRSQDGYFLLMTPLWLAAAATAPPTAFAHAWQPSSGGSSRRPSRDRARALDGRAAGAGRAGGPAARAGDGLPAIAVTTDEPLEMDIVATTAHGAHDQGLWQM